MTLTIGYDLDLLTQYSKFTTTAGLAVFVLGDTFPLAAVFIFDLVNLEVVYTRGVVKLDVVIFLDWFSIADPFN